MSFRIKLDVMLIEQIYTGCLAQAGYYIESGGEAAVIDPLRDIELYIEKARCRNARIKFIFETHFHADFVSGHLDLANATGGDIVYGPTAKPMFPATIGKDGQKFKLGNVEIELLHTPGHTMESCCFLLYNEEGKATALFSGDTLFLGDVGRPDLAQKAANMTQEELAGLLYDSLTNKIVPLPDDIIVYPAHGAGSACGKKMSLDRYDTLGHQKQTNYALKKDLSRDDFIREVLTGLVKPPQYFPWNVAMNKLGYNSINGVIQKGMRTLSVDDVIPHLQKNETLILDTRKPADFAKGFIPGSVNISIDGDFAPWVGTLIADMLQPIIVISDEGREKEVVTRLARVGYDNCIGYLKGGIEEWKKRRLALDTIESISADELATRLGEHPLAFLVDVRRKSEFDTEHVIGAENIPLDTINDDIKGFDKDSTYYIHCAAGYRSMIFISIMKKRGYNNLIDVQGGFKAIKNSGRFFLTQYVEPVTML